MYHNTFHDFEVKINKQIIKYGFPRTESPLLILCWKAELRKSVTLYQNFPAELYNDAIQELHPTLYILDRAELLSMQFSAELNLATGNFRICL